MSPDILNNLLNAVTALIVALLTWFTIRLNTKVKKVRDQVENDHPTNMREEQDSRHTENKDKLDLLVNELPRMRRSLERLWLRSDKHTDQIHDLEMTQPRDQIHKRDRRN